MPAYDYDCAACGRRFEVSHSVYADGPTTCPLCGKGPVRKAITAAAIHYKGSGWAKKERRATASSGSSKASGEGTSSSDGGSTTDGGSTDGGSSDRGSKATEKVGPDAPKAAPAAAKPVESGTTKSKSTD
jgi:putative FmdB family regulatory protein